MSNVDDLLNSLELIAPKKSTTKVLKRFQLRVFGRLFRFDIIREEVQVPGLLSPVEPCQSSEQAAWICNTMNDTEYLKYKDEKLKNWQKEQDESRARMKVHPKDKL